jgi:hypothetical protein
LEDEWTVFTPKQQQAIHAKREERNPRRGVEAVYRHTRPQTETEEIKEDNTSRVTEHNVRAVMSRRHNAKNTGTNGSGNGNNNWQVCNSVAMWTYEIVNVVKNEIDSHADTCFFGHDSHVLSYDLRRTATVAGFLPNMGNVETPIASIAIAYDDDNTSTTYILIFHTYLPSGLIYKRSRP